MDPIQNNGMSNYAMTAPQQQNDIQTPQDDYSSMPMVYDPTADEKKSSASSGLGMKALAALAIAGLAMWGGHAVGSKGAKAAKEAKAAAEDALAKANKATEDALKVAEDTVANAKKLQDANNSAYEVADKEFTGILDFKKDLRNGVKKALRPDEKEAKTTEDAIKKASEDVKAQREAFEKNKVQDAAEEAADAAKEGADNAAESAK